MSINKKNFDSAETLLTATNIIAMDGPAGSGKSSLTKMLACELGLFHIDSGAFYRTAAYILGHEGIDFHDVIPEDQVLDCLNKYHLHYNPHDAIVMKLNDQDITHLIRTPQISLAASKIATNSKIRNWVNTHLRTIVAQQKNLCIMEGRDIGTVIFPGAKLKIFMTASVEARAKRRWDELQLREQLDASTTLEKIQEQIISRDWQDEHRAIAPLKMASDAILIDTTHLTIDQAKEKIRQLILTRFQDIKKGSEYV